MTREQIELRRRLVSATCPQSALPRREILDHPMLVALAVETAKGKHGLRRRRRG